MVEDKYEKMQKDKGGIKNEEYPQQEKMPFSLARQVAIKLNRDGSTHA